MPSTGERRGTWAGRWKFKIGETRNPSIDFAALDEIASQDLTGTPTVVMVDDGSGAEISNATVSGTKVTFELDVSAGVVASADQKANGGLGYTDYELKVTVGTTGGATLCRSATVRIEE